MSLGIQTNLKFKVVKLGNEDQSGALLCDWFVSNLDFKLTNQSVTFLDWSTVSSLNQPKYN